MKNLKYIVFHWFFLKAFLKQIIVMKLHFLFFIKQTFFLRFYAQFRTRRFYAFVLFSHLYALYTTDLSLFEKK